jgi:hypothetical protein
VPYAARNIAQLLSEGLPISLPEIETSLTQREGPSRDILSYQRNTSSTLTLI